MTGLAVVLVFPARAHHSRDRIARQYARSHGRVVPELLIGFTQTLDETAILQRQDRIDQAFTQLATIAVEATRERMAHLASEPDTALMLRMLLRLRHDIVMIGWLQSCRFLRHCKHALDRRLPARLNRGGLSRGSSRALIARRNPPPLAAVDVAFDGYAAEITRFAARVLRAICLLTRWNARLLSVSRSSSCAMISGSSNNV